MNSSDDGDREQQRPWFKKVSLRKLMNPKTLRATFWIGMTTFKVIRWIFDLLDRG